MTIRSYIRNYIRKYGEALTVATSTVILTVLVITLAGIIDLLIHKTVHPDPIYFSALITLVTGPIILHFFVGLISQLDRSEEKLRALSIMDDLTDVYNRRYFLEQAEKEIAKAIRYGNIFSILAVDIDHFKKINDTYGHFAGDAVIQATCNTCMNNLRTMDVFARFGGEEFMFLIPESDKIDVEAFAEKILKALELTEVSYHEHTIKFTVSIGVKTFDGSVTSLDALLKLADEALYEAKRRGRNCIVVHDSAAAAA